MTELNRIYIFKILVKKKKTVTNHIVGLPVGDGKVNVDSRYQLGASDWSSQLRHIGKQKKVKIYSHF